MKLPGFIDSHMHVLGLGYVSFNVDLNEIYSIKDLIDLLNENKNKSIIIGRGWNQENFKEKRFPTKDDLNKVSIDIPILIRRVCGHVLVANDKMMELANINQYSKQISGGTFDYESGLFTEKAINIINNALPKPSHNDLRKYLLKANEILLENGITSVASDDFSTLSIDYEEIINVINELYDEDLLKIKITEQVNLPYKKLKEFIDKGYANKKFNKYKLGPLKILADGSLGGKTASLLKPYENEPDNYGVLTYSDDELFELVHLADSNNMDVVIHAIGDKTSQQAIDTLIKSLKITKRTNHNHAIIHAQLTTREQIKLMKKWNIGAIIQPIFLNSDIPIIESRIGSRAKESYLFKSFYNQGVNVGFSTDSPIEPVDPFKNIYCAVTRKSIKFPNEKPFLFEESFNVSQALVCYTTNNLNYIYEPTLPKGDYIITNQDIYTSKLFEIKDIKVIKTYIDNKLVYINKEE
ncbi:amidohydrolase [Candidatus Izemoplasma sp. B36]|uniref:amidohydrolase n=1 Tax=Candidatus Izemoplasma sp. B36 TaxID=3242468 RepID=UPI003558D7EF